MATTTSNMSLTLPAVSDAADIGVLNSNFQKIDDQLGGKGLGNLSVNTAFIDTVDKLDALRVNRWFIFTGYSNSDPIHASGLTINYAYGRVDNYNENNAKMTLWPHNPADPYNKCELTRYCIENEWTDWEWVNPPMMLGVEYRTTERYQGKAVYTKLVDCGQVTDGKTVYYMVDGMTQFIRHAAKIATATFGDINLPYIYADMSSSYTAYSYANAASCGFKVGANATGQGYLQIWYTKD